MPIGSTYVYNSGDLILSTVSGSGTSFIETKIAAATSSLILFNNNGTLTSASLNSITVGTASYVSGSTSIITNLTASNISASGTSSFGYVGIGTTSPAYKLDLNVTSNSDAFSIKNSGQSRFILNGDAIMNWGASAANGFLSWDTGIAKVGGLSGNVLTLSSNGTEKARIDLNGNVGIGTTLPGALLDVRGQVLVNNVTASVAKNQLTINTNGTNYAQFYDLGTIANTLVLGGSPSITTLPTASISASIMSWGLTSGNVGIGTTNPVGKLDVRAGSGGEIIFGSYDANFVVKIQSGDQLNFYNGASANPGYINYAGGATVLSQNLHVEKATGGTTGLVRINSNCNVGIGTSSPTAKFDVRPDSSWLGSEAVIIDTDGGNNPRIKLYRPDGGSPTSSYAIHLRNDSGNLNILNTGVSAALGSETVTSKFYITTVGNVGIGTTNPTARLHVSGSTIISGSLNVTANITCLSLTETSTEAVKYNILPLPSQLDNVLKLKPVSFNYKANDKHSIGLIAEEVAKNIS